MRKPRTLSPGAPGKILMIVENLPVPFDRRVWQEALALREAGYTVSVICPKGKGHDSSFEELNGINIYRHFLPAERSGPVGYLLEYSVAIFWEFILCLRVRRRHGFDVIHACNPPDLIFLIALFNKLLFGTKFVYDQHDLSPELYRIKFGRQDWLHRWLERLERWSFRSADGSIATNEPLKELAIRRGGMPSDRVWVVKSYPDLSRFRRTPPDPVVGKDFKFLVGYVGIMAEQDGVEYLVRAMAHIVREKGRHDIGCLIIGDGPERARLVSLAEKLTVAKYVNFAGYHSGEQLASKLSACHIGVIPDPPNGCNEKLSMNKVFEYMALGLPFVQFDLEQSKREAGSAARVVAEASPLCLAEGIVSLLDDELARHEMSRYGQERALRDFRWEDQARSLIAAYRTILDAPVKSRATPEALRDSR